MEFFLFSEKNHKKFMTSEPVSLIIGDNMERIYALNIVQNWREIP